MGATSTAQCKQYLAEYMSDSANQQVLLQIYEVTANDHAGRELITLASNPKNWKREMKFKATGDHDYADTVYRTIDYRAVPANDLAWVRMFALSPDRYEDSVKFLLLEDTAGQLHLGEYVGD